MNLCTLFTWVVISVAAVLYASRIVHIANTVFPEGVFCAGDHEDMRWFMLFAEMCFGAKCISVLVDLIVGADNLLRRLKKAYAPVILTTSSGVPHTLVIGTRAHLPLFYDGPHPLNLYATAADWDRYRIGRGNAITLVLYGNNPHMVVNRVSIPVRLVKDDANIPDVYAWCDGPYERDEDVACVMMRCGSTDYTLVVEHKGMACKLYDTEYVCDESDSLLHRFRITWPAGAFGSTTGLRVCVDYGPSTGTAIYTEGPTVMGDTEVLTSRKTVRLVDCATKEASKIPRMALFLWGLFGSRIL